MNVRVLFAGLLAVVATAGLAQAQTPPAPGPAPAAGAQRQPPPMTNLQVFPKDAAREQVLATMRNFTQALGVACIHCHVDDEPSGRPNDMASDEKPPKNKARGMMKMTGELNRTLETVVGKSGADLTRVSCITCHRGVPIPKQIGEVVAATAAAQGMPAAVAQYKELRQKYYGAQAYDFSPAGLITLAARLGADKKDDDAIAWLQVNQEFYPNSAANLVALAQAYQRKGDKAAAIASLEKAVAAEPNNAMAKRMLDNLKK